MKAILYSFIFIVCITSVLSCNEAGTASLTSLKDTTWIIQGEGSCQYLTYDDQKDPVICYIKEDSSDSKNNVMMIARWDGQEMAFATPVEISETKGAQAHDEGMAKIAFKDNGDILLVYSIPNSSERHKYAALVYYILSNDNMKSWSDPVRLVADTSSYSQRFFDICRNSNGEISAIWLDSRKAEDEDGSTLYYAETIKGGGFTNEKIIASSTCECCRTKIYSDQENVLHIAYRDIIHDSIRDMSYIMSADAGKTFTSPERISNDNWVLNGCPHTGPSLVKEKDMVHFTWYTQGGEEGVYYCTTKDGSDFSERSMISNSGRHPQMAGTKGKVHVVYEQINKVEGDIEKPVMMWTKTPEGKGEKRILSEPGGKASYPVILEYQGNLLVMWNQKSTRGKQLAYRMIKF